VLAADLIRDDLQSAAGSRSRGRADILVNADLAPAPDDLQQRDGGVDFAVPLCRRCDSGLLGPLARATMFS
jgi:hypothetical protein